jgi:hypothetical protein
VNDFKKKYKDDDNTLDVNSHHRQDHFSTDMKMIKGRSNAMSAAISNRHQVLNLRVIWDRSVDGFKAFRNNVGDHHKHKLVQDAYLK